MPATTTAAIDGNQRQGLYELVRNHLSGFDGLWLALEHDKDFAKAERLGREVADDLRLLQDIGWGEEEERETFDLTMPADDLRRLLRRLREEAEVLAESGSLARVRREEAEAARRDRAAAYETCGQLWPSSTPGADVERVQERPRRRSSGHGAAPAESLRPHRGGERRAAGGPQPGRRSGHSPTGRVPGGRSRPPADALGMGRNRRRSGRHAGQGARQPPSRRRAGPRRRPGQRAMGDRGRALAAAQLPGRVADPLGARHRFERRRADRGWPAMNEVATRFGENLAQARREADLT